MHAIVRGSGFALLALAALRPAWADDGLMVRSSKYPVAEAMDRLEVVIRQAGGTVHVRIDLKAAAQKGDSLRPHQVILFGRGGAIQPMLSASSRSGIDFPQKILIFEDTNGKTWVAYTKGEYVVQRHGISGDAGASRAASAINKTVGSFVDAIAD